MIKFINAFNEVWGICLYLLYPRHAVSISVKRQSDLEISHLNYVSKAYFFSEILTYKLLKSPIEK